MSHRARRTEQQTQQTRFAGILRRPNRQAVRACAGRFRPSAKWRSVVPPDHWPAPRHRSRERRLLDDKSENHQGLRGPAGIASSPRNCTSPRKSPQANVSHADILSPWGYGIRLLTRESPVVAWQQGFPAHRRRPSFRLRLRRLPRLAPFGPATSQRGDLPIRIEASFALPFGLNRIEVRSACSLQGCCILTQLALSGLQGWNALPHQHPLVTLSRPNLSGQTVLAETFPTGGIRRRRLNELKINQRC